MKKYLPDILLLLTCFFVGIAGSKVDFVVFFQSEIPKTTELQIVDKDRHSSSDLTFTGYGVIADGWDENGNNATFTSYQASDGTIIDSDYIYRIPSKSRLMKLFEKKLRNADQILSDEPYLDFWKKPVGRIALIKSGDTFSLLKFTDCKTDCSMTILQGTSPNHVLALHNQNESLSRSIYLNRL